MDIPLLNVATCVLACVIGVIGCSAPSAPVEASIRGRFVMRGDVPEPAAVTVDKDLECCGRAPMVREELLVGADHGVANVVVYIRNKNIPVPQASVLDPVRVTTNGCRYDPHVVVVQKGQELVIGGDECVGHNPNLVTAKHAPMGSLIPSRGEVAVRFSSSENLPAPMSCNIHPWMKAWVVIPPNPYACVSSPSGEFEMRSVPPGVWELQFWHEAFGCLEEMTVAGDHRQLPKGRMTVEVGDRGIDLGAIDLDYGKLTKRQAEPGVGADSR